MLGHQIQDLRDASASSQVDEPSYSADDIFRDEEKSPSDDERFPASPMYEESAERDHEDSIRELAEPSGDSSGEVPPRPLRVAIVHEYSMTRQLLRRMIEREFGLAVVGEAATADEAFEVIVQANPDVVLIEMSIGNVDSIELVERVRQNHRDPRFIVVSAKCDELTVLRVDRARLHGFVDKRSELCCALRRAIHEASHGRRYFSASYLELKEARVADPFSFDKVLTRREHEVLALVAQQVPDHKIVKQLCIGRGTLRSYRRAIASKFNVPVKDLPIFARAKGFGR